MQEAVSPNVQKRSEGAVTQGAAASPTPGRVRLSPEQFTEYNKNGFLIVRGLLNPGEIAELRGHTEDILAGRLPEQQHRMRKRDVSKDPGDLIHELEAPPEGCTPLEAAQHFVRLHMLHRKIPLHERYLLHPRILDVYEGLIGPDILALQSMLFLKPPGKDGQGWHQDSYYIPTYPDSLCGAWIAIDDCDEENGAMWFAAGSHAEPTYPAAAGYGWGHRQLRGIMAIHHPSATDDSNELAPIAERYPQVLAAARAGDVVFFHGRVLHRSKRNQSADRFRRSFVIHACSARSHTPWGVPETGGAMDLETMSTNGLHILARGDTHLAFAKPSFGTPCAALLPKEERMKQTVDAVAMVAGVNIWAPPAD